MYVEEDNAEILTVDTTACVRKDISSTMRAPSVSISGEIIVTRFFRKVCKTDGFSGNLFF